MLRVTRLDVIHCFRLWRARPGLEHALDKIQFMPELGEESKYPDCLSLRRRRPRKNADLRKRNCRHVAQRHRDQHKPGDGDYAAGNSDNSNCVCIAWRSGWQRIGRQHKSSWRKRYGLSGIRRDDGGQMARVDERSRAARHANRLYPPPRRGAASWIGASGPTLLARADEVIE